MGERETGPMSPDVAVMVLRSANPQSPNLVAEAVSVLAELVNQNVPEFVDMTDAAGLPQCWHFIGYQPGGARDVNVLNPPDAPQYQGVVFADGTVAMRWLTARRSHSVWSSFAEMFDVHGHPEYGTEIHWPNGAPAEAREVIERAAQAYRERQEIADAPDLNVVGPQELPGTVASSPDGWVVSSLAELTDEQAAEVLGQPGAQRWTGTHFEPAQQSDQDGNTLAVCLDCQGTPTDSGGWNPLVVALTAKAEADHWITAHRENNPTHRAVTVPGWPRPARAIAIARQTVRENGGRA
jgi:hypothetical protein